MRQGIVHLHFDDFRVDHNEAQVVRRGLEKQRENYGVYADALAAAGGARNQRVGHFCEVEDDGNARDVLAERDGNFRAALVPFARFYDVAHAHHAPVLVGNLNADRALPRNRGDNADFLGADSESYVVFKARDSVEPDTRCGTNLITRNNGARGSLYGGHRYSEFGDCFYNLGHALLIVFALAGKPVARLIEQIHRREDVSVARFGGKPSLVLFGLEFLDAQGFRLRRLLRNRNFQIAQIYFRRGVRRSGFAGGRRECVIGWGRVQTCLVSCCRQTGDCQ